jgi:cell division protein FtsN
MYSNAASADKTRQALTEDGLAVKVVKAYIDERLVYRVQVGPYQEQDQVSEAQVKLAARGIHGVIRKSEEKFA